MDLRAGRALAILFLGFVLLTKYPGYATSDRAGKNNQTICSNCNINNDKNYGLRLTTNGKYIYKLFETGHENVTVTYNTSFSNSITYTVTLNPHENKPYDVEYWNKNITLFTQRNEHQLTIFLNPSLFNNSFGINDILIELGSDNVTDILELFVYFDVAPEDVYVPPDYYARVNVNKTFEASLKNGTTLLVEWMISKNRSKLYDYRKVNFPTTFSHTERFSKAENLNMTVIVANELHGISMTFTIHVLYPIHGIGFNLERDIIEPGQTVMLHIRFEYPTEESIGVVNITISFMDGQQPKAIECDPDSEQNRNISQESNSFNTQGDFKINITIKSKIDKTVETLYVHVWPRINVELQVFENVSAVGNDVLFQFINTSSHAFNYMIQFGDGKQEENDTEALSLNNTLNHVYEQGGNYNVTWVAHNAYNHKSGLIVVIIKSVIPKMNLLPNNSIYPIPDGKVLFSLTMLRNDSVSTYNCTFSFGDGEVIDIVLNVSYDKPFIYEHRYLNRGIFNINFECQTQMWNRTLTIVPLRLNKITSLLVAPIPMNETYDRKSLQFNLNANGMVRPPPNASVVWNFDDATAQQQVALLNWTKTHTFLNKGVYNVSATVFYNGETKVVHFPTRIGIVLLFVNQTIGRVHQDCFNFTADVPAGSNLKLTLLFDDGREQQLENKESVLHVYNEVTIYHPTLTGSNTTFSETMVLNPPLNVDYSIDSLLLEIENHITHPPGLLNVNFAVPQNSNPIENLSCTIKFGDSIVQQTYNITVNIEQGRPSSYPYQYQTLGRYLVEVHCHNRIGSKTVKRNVTVTNGCFTNEGMFDRQYSHSDSPLVVYTHSTVEVRGRPAIACYDMAPVYEWRIRQKNGSNWKDIPMTINSYSEAIVFKNSPLPAGLYELTLNVSFQQLRDNWLAETTYIEFVDSPLIANIDGGELRVTPSKDIVIDAASLSYDPKLGMGKTEELDYIWECGSFPSSSVEELRQYRNNSKPMSCDKITKPEKKGVKLFLASKVQHSKGYVFKVRVSRGVRSSYTAIQLIQVQSGAPLVKIACVINCEMKTAVSSDLSFESQCLTCSQQEKSEARYSWTLTWEENNETVVNVPHFQQGIFNTGLNHSAIVIRKNYLEAGKEYKLNLELALPGRTSRGFASMAIVTNIPPRGGNCIVQPSSGYALKTEFVIKCFGWQDEGYRLQKSDVRDGREPKSYTYILVNGNVHMVLYDGEASTSPRLSLPVQPKTTSTYQLIVRIYDILNDYTEYPINVTVLSPIEQFNTTEEDEYDPDEEAVKLASVKKIIDATNQSIEEAKASKDLMKNLNVLTSLASVLNEVKVPDESTLASKTLKTGTTKSQWEKLWKDYQMPRDGKLVTIISEKMEEMSDIVASHVTDIEQLNGDQLSTLSEGMAVILQDSAKTTLNSAKICSTIVKRASKVLHDLSKKKPYPMKAKVIAAIEGTVNFMNKILTKALPDPNKKMPSDVHEDVVPEPDDMSDLHKEENVFLMRKTAQANLANKYIQINKSEEIMKNIEQALPAVLDTMSSLQVKGEGPLMIGDGEITMITEKRDVESKDKGFVLVSPYFTTSLVEPGFQPDYDDAWLDNVDEENVLNDESTVKDDVKDTKSKPRNVQFIELQAIEFKKNPFIFGKDAETNGVTSPVLMLQIKDETSRLIDFPLKLRIKKNTTSLKTYNTQDTRAGSSGLLYHRFRLKYQNDSTSIFVKTKQTHLNVTCYLRSKRPPTLHKFDFKITAGLEDVGGQQGYRVFITTNTLMAGLNYLGILMSEDGKNPSENKKRVRRNVDETLTNLTRNGFDVSNVEEYEMVLHTEGCRVWDKTKQMWDTEFCKVSKFSTIAETFCNCGPNAPGNSFASSFYVPPNTIDFDLVFTKFDISNASVYGLLIAVAVIYIPWVLWARKQDRKDKQRWKVGYLKDNLVMDKYFYLITVYTGLRKNSGTRSNISFVLVGDSGDTGVRQLADGERTVDTGTVMNLIMSVPASLGDLSYLRIWHDNTGRGTTASWFLNKIVVEDLHESRRYIFICDRWMAVDKDDGQLDVVLPVAVQDEFMTFDKLFSEHTRFNMTDTHLWLSVFMRPERCTFTRVQRVSCCLALLMLVMIASAMFFKEEAKGQDEETIRHEVKIGMLRFSMTAFYISTISLLLTMPPTVVLVMLFKSTKPKKKPDKEESTHSSENTAEGMRFENIEDDVLQVRYHNKPLPHMFLYVAWLLLGIIVFTCSFFLILYSMQWGKATSEEWLTSFVLCFIQSIIVIDPLKVVLVALMLTFCLRDPFFTNGDVDMNRVESEAEKFGLIKTDASKDVPEPLPPAVLAKARKRRFKEMKAQSVFFELIQYVVFLFAIYSLSFGNRDDRSYMLHEHIENNLFKESRNVIFPFESVRSYEGFILWANETFIPHMFPEKDIRGHRLPWTTRLFFGDLTNFRVGPARIRQVRMPQRQSPFYGNKYKSLVSDITYYGSYSLFGEESGDYCLGWTDEPCPVSEEASHFTSPAWKYTQPSDVWGIPVPGKYRLYSGGGYMLELNVNYDVSIEMINELFAMSWLDRRTRAVFVEFTLYNAYVNIMAHCRFTAEFPETGSTIVWHDIMTFRLAQHLGSIGAYVLLCEVIIGIIVIMFTITILKKLYDQRLQYFKHLWQMIDFITVIWCVVAIIFYIFREVNAAETLKRFRADPKKFINFQHIAVWDTLFVNALGALLFSTTIRVLRILGYNKRVTVIAAVLSYSARDLSGFGIVFGIVFFAYVLSGYILFSAHYYGYHTIYDSMFTIFTYMLGKNIMGRLMLIAPIWAQIYFLTLVFFIIFVLLTMFQAIMNNSMTIVRDNIRKVHPPYGLIDVLVNIYRGLIRDWLPDSFFKVPDGEETENLKRRQLQQLEKYGVVKSEQDVEKSGVKSPLDPEVEKSRVKSPLDPEELVVEEKDPLDEDSENNVENSINMID